MNMVGLIVGGYGAAPPSMTCPTAAINFWGKGPPFRAAIGITCVLSLIGALLIIFSYAFFKTLRSNARLILVHLSLMDLGVSVANLVGDIVYFDRFYFSPGNNSCPVFHQPKHQVMQNLCVAQAYFAHYFTQSSILWTISLAIYLYFLIVHHRTPIAKYSLRLSYVLCYGLPAIVSTWLAITHRFGYSPSNTGWCSILVLSPETNTPDIFASVIGYDMWIYLAMTLVPLVYLAVQLFIREKFKQTRQYLRDAEGRFWEAVYILDYQFLFIPLVFTLLRMWTCIVGLLYVYIQIRETPDWLNVTLVYFAGIGDSAQGFANAILFVLFSRRVRQTVFNFQYWRSKLGLMVGSEYEPLVQQSMKSTIKIDDPIPNPSSDFFTPNYHSGTESLTASLNINKAH